MTAARRDLAWMGAAIVLLLTGAAAWWRMPMSRRTAEHIDLPLLALWLSAAAIIVGVVWLLDHRPGEGWSPIVTSLTLAATAPLSVLPLVMPGNPGIAARAGLILTSLAVLPLAWTLAGAIARPRDRQGAWIAAVACVAASVVIVLTIGWAWSDGFLGDTRSVYLQDHWGLRWLFVAAATVVPGVIAAASVSRGPVDGFGSDRAIVSAVALAGAGVLPAITGMALLSPTLWPALVIPVAAALAMVAILSKVAIAPLARSAVAAAGQRDLVVAASEGERVRLAAALHDGPLSDVAVLVQRLDTAGDEENAALARSIADELRGLGNDLRLPIVEDLGAGAAIEWLVGRVAPAPGSIVLTVDERGRPPMDVEAAIYRIAQEAVLNATRHGAPPMTVRYTSEVDHVSLVVEDAGAGLPADAATAAGRDGRLGLVMMRQRAEAIGAQLQLGRAASGGASVRLTWPSSAT